MRLLIPLALLLALAGCAPAPADYEPCTADQLGIDVMPREDDVPELVVVDVVLTNTGDAGCSLEGIPGVAITSAISHEVIGTAVPTTDSVEVVPLAPDYSAYVLVSTLKATKDTDTCEGEITDSLRVTLPGDTDAAAIVSSSPVAQYCDEPSRGTFTTSAITAEPLVVEGVDDFVPMR